MMRHTPLLLVLVARTAAAQPPAETPSTPAPQHEALVGVAINNPLMWNDGDNVAISVYVRFAPKQIVRVNGARYHYAGPVGANVANLVHHGFNDNDQLDYGGWIEDLSVGWSYYPRRAFDGPSIELAALWRDADKDIYIANKAFTFRHTREEGARALVGWSWLFRERAFAAVAVGASTGFAKGHQNSGPDTTMGESVDAWTASLEGYLRFGFVFGN
jgi:hypothetical protein